MKKLLAMILVLCLFAFTACSDESAASTAGDAGEASNTTQADSGKEKAETASSKEQPKSSSKSIYDDDKISASFVRKYDVPDVKGMFYFDIEVQNKTDKKISIYLKDSYVNGTTFQTMSGTPMDILPKKNSAHAFIGAYKGTGISSVDKIKKIGFKIYVTDENAKEIETTKAVEIKF